MQEEKNPIADEPSTSETKKTTMYESKWFLPFIILYSCFFAFAWTDIYIEQHKIPPAAFTSLFLAGWWWYNYFKQRNNNGTVK
jgi:hypothetical protein